VYNSKLQIVVTCCTKESNKSIHQSNTSLYSLHTYLLTYILTYLFTYLLTYGAEPSLRSRQLCSPSRTSQHFMEPEGSIPSFRATDLSQELSLQITMNICRNFLFKKLGLQALQNTTQFSDVTRSCLIYCCALGN
jgi:hypothetical protein